MRKYALSYDKTRWKEEAPIPTNTLQIFITNKCNMRCKACFYAHNLGRKELLFRDYKKILLKYSRKIRKVIILGGEPTLYKNLNKAIDFNTSLGLRTTVYTNGFNLKILKNVDLSKTTIRIGVYGAELSEKPLEDVPYVPFPVTIVYMLRKDNIKELMKAVKMAEERFNCQKFYISSIRDITMTHDYWKDTKETLPLNEYYKVIQEFLKDYNGNIKELHIAKRGIITTQKNSTSVNKCRFGNIFPDIRKIICPLDISKQVYTKELKFNKRFCNKNKECILQKIILKRVNP